MTCYHLPNGGIACSRGRKIKPEELAKDLELIAQFERELEEGKYDKRRSQS